MKGSVGGFTGGTTDCDFAMKGMPGWVVFKYERGAVGLLGGPEAAYGLDTGARARAGATGGALETLFAFCRAILARVSMMLAGTAGGAGFGQLLRVPGVSPGGLPGGVVD